MSDYWDFYFCRVENRPASIFLDMGICRHVPDLSKPWLGWLIVKMRQPREDGLSSKDEFETLSSLEDVLQGKLDGCDHHVSYVGRNTCNGCRDYYFYADNALSMESLIAEVMSEFPQYEYDLGGRDDSDWETYRDFLYPDGRTKQTMKDRSVIEALQREGDDGSGERDVRHWAYFPSNEEATGYLEAAIEGGYKQAAAIEASEAGEWGVILDKHHSVDLDSIGNVTLHLYDLARAHNGTYDGWETPVLKDNQ